MSSQKAKSLREKQDQIRDILLQFDLETQINKIVTTSVNDLLRENKQAFQYIQETDKKISLLQTRLLKVQSFEEIVQKNVASKFEIANNLNKRLQLFNSEFYEKLKANEQVINTMRNDYDSLLSSNQKNTFEVRTLGDNIKKCETEVQAIQSSMAAQVQKMLNILNENQNKLEKQFIQIRKQTQKTMIGLSTAKAELLSKSKHYEEVSRDLALYNHEKEALNNRIDDIFQQVKTKLPHAQFYQMRLSFDSQIVTEKQFTMKMFKDIRLSVKQQITQRKADTKAIRDQRQSLWKVQKALNKTQSQQMVRIDGNLQQQIDQTNAKLQVVQINLKKEIELLDQRQKTDITQLKKFTGLLQKRIQANETKICDNQKNLQARYDEICEISSTIESINQQLTIIIEEAKERRLEMKKLQSKANVGQSANQVLQGVNDQLFQFKKTITALKLTVKQLLQKNINLEHLINQKDIKWQQALQSQKQQVQSKHTEINRRINNVSIQIMDNLNKVESEAKRYTDQFKNSIMSKLQFIYSMSEEINKLKLVFQEKMKEADAINKSITEKMEKTNTNITKFKSDMIIKIEGISSEQHRRSVEVKELVKLFQQSRKLLGFLTESTQILLSIVVHRQVLQQNENGKEPIKMSSLSQGWILQIDDKLNKYRGQLIIRKKMALVCLNSLISYGDKIKGYLIESGKDVYNRMLDEFQQIFLTKKKIKSIIKIVPQMLPKLHF